MEAISDSEAETSEDPLRRHVGVIGLGQMGRGIAANLDRAGLLRAAYDVAPDAFDRSGLSRDVENALPVEIAEICDVILLVLPSSVEIEACMEGDDGLLSVSRDAQVLVDLTTSYPSDTARLAARADEVGRAYVDCGMTGGAAGADTGTLTLMIGGADGDVERVRPVLDHIASKIFHVGPSTSGHKLKLIHNMILHTVFFATSEGCRAAEQAGLDLEKVIEVFNAGNARSFITEVRFPRHIISGRFDGRSYVGTLAKDLGMATRFVDEIGAPAAYGPFTSHLLDKAVAAGRGGDDFTLIYRYIDDLLAGERIGMSRQSASREEPE